MHLQRRWLLSLVILVACAPPPVEPGGDRFPETYVSAYDGAHVYEVIPGLEMAMILTAVATEEDPWEYDLVERDTDYYREIIEHFGPFRDHPVFEVIGLIKDDLGTYQALRNNSYNWVRCGDSFCRQDFLDRWWRGEEFVDTFSPNMTLIEDFAEESGFWDFFHGHQAHYDELAALYQKQVDLPAMIGWLYENFPYEYDSYRILFSPLMQGNQTTTIKRSKTLDQVLAIVGPPMQGVDLANGVMAFRWIFTELDHQYVDPAASLHETRVDEIFADRAFWTAGKQSDSYRTPYRIFTEYLTWAVFMIYVHENYEPEIGTRVQGPLVEWFEERRGFPRFGQLLDTLSALRRESGESLQDLIPALLDWAEQHRKEAGPAV